MAAWRDLASDAELVVSCGGRLHRLVWSAGTVTLADHPDLAAERALVALGGPEPACLAHLRLWNDAVTDGGFLAEWVDEAHLDDARRSWLATALERMRLEGFHEFLRHLPPARAERMGQFVLRFPRPWLDRAACAVAENVTGDSPDGRAVACTHAPSLLEQAVAHRLRRAFVSSVGQQGLVSWGAAALVPLRVHLAPATGSITPGERPVRGPAISGQLTGAGRGVDAHVAPTWLHRVWGAGAAVIDGHLILSLDTAPHVPGERTGGSPVEEARRARCAVMTTGQSDGASGLVVTVTTGEAILQNGRWHLTAQPPEGRDAP